MCVDLASDAVDEVEPADVDTLAQGDEGFPRQLLLAWKAEGLFLTSNWAERSIPGINLHGAEISCCCSLM
jgi:hypothetical protein